MTIKYEYIDENVSIFNLSDYKLINVKCDIDVLKFNPFNDRFAMESSNYKTEHRHELGLDQDSQNFIYELLWGANKHRNEQTKKDILEKNVLNKIVIDKTGTILDGNRRVAILRRIVSDRVKLKLSNAQVESFKFQSLVMINQKLEQKQIRKVETILQISEDEKLDYDPINLYLKINRLFREIRDDNLNAKDTSIFTEISQLLGPKYSVRDVKERHETFRVMEKFLRFINAPRQYKHLRGKEDHFKQIKSFQAFARRHKLDLHGFGNQSYDDNVNDIEDILFQLTSAHVEGKLFRQVVPLSKKTQSPLLFGPGVTKFQNYINHKLKTANGNIVLYQNNHRQIDNAIKSIIQKATRYKKSDNHSAGTKNIFMNIRQNISNLDEWNKKLTRPYKCDAKVEATIYQFIGNLKKIIRAYKNNDED